MILIQFGSVVRHEPSTKSSKDKRVRVAKAICSYFAGNGDEYRRAFEMPKNTPLADFTFPFSINLK